MPNPPVTQPWPQIIYRQPASPFIDGGYPSGARPVDPGTDYPVAWESNFTLPDQDVNGWSVLTPSVDSRLMYVSTSGNDGTGQSYLPADAEIGSDPQNPTGSINAYLTIAAATAQQREGFPDWVMLKRGDEWVAPGVILPATGRSVSERSVVSYYGASVTRPLIKSGTTNNGVKYLGQGSNSAVMGLEFYSYTRNPADPSYVGDGNTNGGSGIYAYGGDEDPYSGVLIEDCIFSYYAGNSVQSVNKGTITDFILRRNTIHHNYSEDSHSQGLYVDYASLLLEENLFDHNGWLIQSITGFGAKANGQATLYNHNTYFASVTECIFRGNLSLRPSSIGAKFTSNSGGGVNVINADKILLDNNAYLEGEVGISIGGNDQWNFENGPRWGAMYAVNNVMQNVGLTQPTNRGDSLGWGLDVQDWDTGVVSGNVFSKFAFPSATNIWAITVIGSTTDTLVTENVVYDIEGNLAVNWQVDSATNSYIDNEMQSTKSSGLMGGLAGSVISGGVYHSAAAAGDWFAYSGSTVDYATWLAASGETGSSVSQIAYTAPDRDINSYAVSLGAGTDIEGFITEALKQSKFNWRTAYTAKAFNNYIREGFDK